jgi:hypothetical protein
MQEAQQALLQALQALLQARTAALRARPLTLSSAPVGEDHEHYIHRLRDTRLEKIWEDILEKKEKKEKKPNHKPKGAINKTFNDSIALPASIIDWGINGDGPIELTMTKGQYDRLRRAVWMLQCGIICSYSKGFTRLTRVYDSVDTSGIVYKPIIGKYHGREYHSINAHTTQYTLFGGVQYTRYTRLINRRARWERNNMCNPIYEPIHYYRQLQGKEDRFHIVVNADKLAPMVLNNVEYPTMDDSAWYTMRDSKIHHAPDTLLHDAIVSSHAARMTAHAARMAEFYAVHGGRNEV